MRFPLIPRRKINFYPEIRKDLWKAFFSKACKTPSIEEFEEKFARFIGTKYAVSVASGRTGLSLIVRALELKEGDEVILPSCTHPSVPSVLTSLGLRPIFVDIRLKDCNMNAELLKSKMSRKTKLVIATHLLGQPCDLMRIMEISKEYNAVVIEDCAQAIGAEIRGKKAGSLGFAGLFSFNLTKPLNMFGGGMITSDNKEFIQDIRNQMESYPCPGKIQLLKRLILGFTIDFFLKPLVFSVVIFPVLILGSPWKQVFIKILKNALRTAVGTDIKPLKFSPFQALVGLKQLQYIDRWNQKQTDNIRMLLNALKPEVQVPLDKSVQGQRYYFAVILSESKHSLARRLLLAGIDTDSFVLTNCAKRYSKEYCKIGENIEKYSLQIPVYPSLKEHDIAFIAEMINRYYL